MTTSKYTECLTKISDTKRTLYKSLENNTEMTPKEFAHIQAINDDLYEILKTHSVKVGY